MTRSRDQLVPAPSTTPSASAAEPEGAGARLSVAEDDDAQSTIASRVSVKSLTVALAPIVILGALILFEVPICPARVFVGVPCPGCGLTRATEAMMAGDFAEMARYHPLAPLITPLFVYGMVRIALVTSGILRRRAWDPLKKVPEWAWTIVAVVVLGVYGLRLAGLLGGMQDPVDFTEGMLYRGASAVLSVLFPS